MRNILQFPYMVKHTFCILQKLMVLPWILRYAELATSSCVVYYDHFLTVLARYSLRAFIILMS
jgi:hypothetical protein